MNSIHSNQPAFRFAPSPNGRLHLGHAFSALMNQKLAREAGGRLLLRIEDIDLVRCTRELERQLLEDLQWLGFQWDEEPLRQSDRLDIYGEYLSRLGKMGLVYPAFMSRSEVKSHIRKKQAEGFIWPHDPDGSPHYPDTDRLLDNKTRQVRLVQGHPHTLRLDMEKALKLAPEPLVWLEGKSGCRERVVADPALWGDIVLSGKDIPASYHLASVVDDALSGITHVVRGRDLYQATSVHQLLQKLLGLRAPLYHHHDLVLDDTGRKLSKSNRDTSLADLRAEGASPEDIRQRIGI